MTNLGQSRANFSYMLAPCSCMFLPKGRRPVLPLCRLSLLDYLPAKRSAGSTSWRTRSPLLLHSQISTPNPLGGAAPRI